MDSPRKGGVLESITLYRKVPRDLTDATRLGGALSLACAGLMAYLFVSNIAAYLKVETVTDVMLDDSGETKMKLFFNITMERLPCQFASVDLFDTMGTSLTNISAEVFRFKVGAGEGSKSEFYVQQPHAIKHEQLDDKEIVEYKTMPDTLPMLGQREFQRFIETNDLVLVAFGAPWCPWSQRLEPIWQKTYAELRSRLKAGKQQYNAVRMGRVDCTAQNAQSLCQAQHIHAFPTIRIYRHKVLHSHENYLGDRDSTAFMEFIDESLPHARPSSQPATQHVAGQRVDSHSLDGEGCQLTGTVHISRVPGNLRISAVSKEHSFNMRVMNVSHHVDRLLFSSPRETTRLHHVLPLEQRSGLLSSTYSMHAELATLKHYLKVVPFGYVFLDGEKQHTYLYKANYNEYKPRKLEWYEGKADAYVDTDLVPNAAFHYDISPVMVVMEERTQSFSSFVTKICAVIGGIYTVVGLVDSVVYHTGQSIKKMS